LAKGPQSQEKAAKRAKDREKPEEALNREMLLAFSQKGTKGVDLSLGSISEGLNGV